MVAVGTVLASALAGAGHALTPGEPIGGGLSAVDGALYVGHGFSFFTEASLAAGGLVAYR